MGQKLDLPNIIIIGVLIWAVFTMQGTGGTTTTNGLGTIEFPSLVEDTTVTFSTWDFYSKGTDAGTGHRVISLNGRENVQINDDGTLQASPGQTYDVLLGNLTTNHVAGTDYYPLRKQGEIPDQGTFTISGGQFLTAAPSDVTFTFRNEDDDTNTLQSLAAGEEAVMTWRVKLASDKCFGNPDVGAPNTICYTYNTSYAVVEQLDGTRADQPSAVNAPAGTTSKCYEFPVICDTQKSEWVSVRIKAGSNFNPDEDHIQVTFSDITYDLRADTLEIISGIEDEDGNDIGVADFLVQSPNSSYSNFSLRVS